ncbi:nitrogen regulatory protein P-II family [Dethiosulfatibacter aminovorans DSM 17477]|uniref:Nitrogen regulatory protein P-II family n=1 Tax=Dethiosulfatibacter aminovorans DSM 17477 TaxID=1121476 RepID=A0A1M6I9I5_9FIRM|nr:P-II family nitrogen regulator [Dethiosulfatibacter aminovorans]SHJ31043.1 nitrogen regulatory protein P-II family [Dethiosulfatibacter aminovorans DSM 17477]
MPEKMTKIEIITRVDKLDELKEALIGIGVRGMHVFEVLGCGNQKGFKQKYRGVDMTVDLLPKVKLETIVCEVPVQLVIDTAVKVLRTGEIGDGKIFTYNVESALRIRTGETGVKAL